MVTKLYVVQLNGYSEGIKANWKKMRSEKEKIYMPLNSDENYRKLTSYIDCVRILGCFVLLPGYHPQHLVKNLYPVQKILQTKSMSSTYNLFFSCLIITRAVQAPKSHM